MAEHMFSLESLDTLKHKQEQKSNDCEAFHIKPKLRDPIGAEFLYAECNIEDLYDKPFDMYETYLKEYLFARIDYKNLYDYLKDRIYGQDNELLKICACLKAYFSNVCQEKREDIPYHIILTGPTGCGKTEVFRNLEKYFKELIPDLPIVLRDATNLTSEGYVGEGKNYLIRDLIDTNGYGIVFVDEFDKRIRKGSYDGSINFAAETQNGLLQMIDGAVMDIDSELGDTITVDTNNTLFICMGAFEEDLVEEKHPGFNNINYKPKRKDLTYESLIKWGCEKQLAARFCQIVNFNEVTEEVLEKIIDKYIKQYSKSLNCKIIMSKTYRDELKRTFDKNYGIRNIRSMIWRDLQIPYLYIENPHSEYIYLQKVSKDGLVKTKQKEINK